LSACNGPVGVLTAKAREESTRLQRENRLLQMERERDRCVAFPVVVAAGLLLSCRSSPELSDFAGAYPRDASRSQVRMPTDRCRSDGGPLQRPPFRGL